MNHFFSSANLIFQKTQTGFSLIELMISATLSSLVILAAVQMMLTNTQTSRAQSGLTQVDESGRFSFDFMREDFQMAGSGGDITEAGVDPLVWSETKEGEDDFDTVTLQRKARQGYTCTGATIESDVDLLIWSRYQVIKDKNAPGSFQLICQYIQPEKNLKPKATGIIAEGVDSFQVLYGVSTKEQPLEPEAYLRRDQIKPGHHKVLSIQIGLILHSTGDKSLRQMAVFDSSYWLQALDKRYQITKGSRWDDGLIRRAFETTILLKNVARYREF